jgi:hypothetical protein
MPRKNPPSKNWLHLTKKFVKEWPEVLEGLNFQNLPIKYLNFINITLKNGISMTYDIQQELKKDTQRIVAKRMMKTIESHYTNIVTVDLKFDVERLKKDITQKTDTMSGKIFKK